MGWDKNFVNQTPANASKALQGLPVHLDGEGKEVNEDDGETKEELKTRETTALWDRQGEVESKASWDRQDPKEKLD